MTEIFGYLIKWDSASEFRYTKKEAEDYSKTLVNYGKKPAIIALTNAHPLYYGPPTTSGEGV